MDLTTEYLKAIKSAATKEQATLNLTLSDKKVATDEKQQLELERLEMELKGMRAQLKRTDSIHYVRLGGLFVLLLLVVGWLGAILKFVYWSAIQNPTKDTPILKLSDAVLIALISTTTINVVGLFIIAAKWLYGNQEGASEKKDKPDKPKE